MGLLGGAIDSSKKHVLGVEQKWMVMGYNLSVRTVLAVSFLWKMENW